MCPYTNIHRNECRRKHGSKKEIKVGGGGAVRESATSVIFLPVNIEKSASANQTFLMPVGSCDVPVEQIRKTGFKD